MRRVLLLLALCAVCLLAAYPGAAETGSPAPAALQTVTLRQGVAGYTGNSNATLNRWSPEANFGSPVALLTIRPSVAGALLRFDLESIPSNAYVTRAMLDLYATSSSNACALTLSAYPMLRPWQAGEATWYQAAAGEDWQRPGADDTYVDRSGVAAGQVSIPTWGATHSIDVTALVRDWVRNPAANYGVALQGSAACSVQYQFAADAFSAPAQRAGLVITYSIDPRNDFAPTLRLPDLHQGDFVSGVVTIRPDVSDDRGVSLVRYALDGAALATVDSAPYSYDWDTAGASPGRHTLTVRARDSAGQWSARTLLLYVYRMQQGILTIGHISDVHVGTPWQGEPSNPALYAARFEQTLQELNSVIKPAVIINTGDSVSLADEYSSGLYAGIADRSAIPIKTIAGNHDLSDRDNYLYRIGQTRLWFDVGPHRFIGFTANELSGPWLRGLLSATEKTGIIFGHYVMRLPAGSTSPTWFYTLPASELSILQKRMAAYGAAAYLSGHYHNYFLLEDSVSHAVEIGAPSTGQKGAYTIVTSDNGVISANQHYLGDWPAVVVTSPQRFYTDGGSKRLAGVVPIRAKVYGPAQAVKVTYSIDGVNKGKMQSLGDDVWQVLWDTTAVAPGGHIITVRATDSQARMRQADIQVLVSRPSAPTPTPTATRAPTATPTATPTTAPGGFTLRVNAGGPAYSDPTGKAWAADRPFVAGEWGYVGGEALRFDTPIGGTATPPLYRTCRRWTDVAGPGYRISLANGRYQVRLKFAEGVFDLPAQRRFAVTIEEQVVLSDFDILTAAGGPNLAAPDQVFVADVYDGELTLGFVTTTGLGESLLNAIEVTRL